MAVRLGIWEQGVNMRLFLPAEVILAYSSNKLGIWFWLCFLRNLRGYNKVESQLHKAI